MSILENAEVLLVEDNPDDAELTMRSLRRSSPAARLAVAGDGAEALDYLFGRGPYAGGSVPVLPRLLILDLKLPKITGLEVLRRIKEDQRTRTIPVVMLSSSREHRDIAASYDLGANSYMVKPAGFDRFVDCVEELGLYWLQCNSPPI